MFPTVYIDQRHWSVTDLSYSYFALATGFFLGTIFIIVIGGVAKKKRERLGIKQDLYDIFKMSVF